MKITIHIFTFYMLALSLVPCGDGGGGLLVLVNHFFAVEHSMDSGHDQHSNECEDDLCSPFCICSCCSSVIDAPSKLPFRIKVPAPVPNSAPICFHNEISYSFNQSIWQPPKLS